jgi:hypothetical protein
VVTLLTAIYGGYNSLNGLPVGHGFDRAVCVTDDPSLSGSGWETLYVPSEEGFRLAAKGPKLTPFEFVDDDIVVWVDGSVTLLDGQFCNFALDALDGMDVVAFDHPEPRDCLFQEAAYCQDWPQNREMPLREQTAHYRSEGMPERFGLWACGALGWRQTPEAVAFGQAWIAENRRWSTRDQVSFPYLLWKMPVRFGTFPAHQFDNDMLAFRPHHYRR